MQSRPVQKKEIRVLPDKTYSCLIQAIEAWEQAFGRTVMLPIEEVQIENQCGYIFRGSTNQIKYIEDYEYQQSDCA